MPGENDPGLSGTVPRKRALQIVRGASDGGVLVLVGVGSYVPPSGNDATAIDRVDQLTISCRLLRCGYEGWRFWRLLNVLRPLPADRGCRRCRRSLIELQIGGAPRSTSPDLLNQPVIEQSPPSVAPGDRLQRGRAYPIPLPGEEFCQHDRA